MLLSVIVPTHNRCDALEKTLEKLSCQNFSGDWEVIVVNNNCTDKTDSVVETAAGKFPVSLRLVHEKTPGASAARNAGARTATGEYLIFVDNDILTEPNFLQLHYNALRQNPNSWIVGQVVNLPEQETSVFGQYRKKLFPIVSTAEPVRETDGITGQNVSLPREHFVKLNGFDENFSVASGEDHEFAMRAKKQLGIKTLIVPSILVFHNDWAGWTFPDFCRRQGLYARTEFFFWQKYGDEHPRQQLVQRCLPINLNQDNLKLILRKIVRKILAARNCQRSLLWLSANLESKSLLHPLLWQVYKMTLSGAIYNGFREGMKNFLDQQNQLEKERQN